MNHGNAVKNNKKSIYSEEIEEDESHVFVHQNPSLKNYPNYYLKPTDNNDEYQNPHGYGAYDLI